MKVIDIISNQNLNEAGTGIAADILQGIGKGVSAAYKGVKGIMDSSSLVTALSQHPGFMRRILKGDPPSIVEIERMYGKKAADIVRKDDTIFSKAANKYYKERKAAVKARSKDAELGGMSRAERAYVKTAVTGSKVTSFLNKVWGAQLAYLVGDSLYECWNAISMAEEKLKAGEISQELYEKHRTMWISHTVTKLATAGVGALVIKGLGGTSTKFFGSIHPSLGWMSNTVKQLGQSWWMYYAQSEEGGNALASWLVGTSMIGMAAQYGIISAYDATIGKFTKMTDTAVNTMQTAVEKAEQQGQGANPSQEKPQSPKSDQSATSTAPVPGTQMNQVSSGNTSAGPSSAGMQQIIDRERQSNKW